MNELVEKLRENEAANQIKHLEPLAQAAIDYVMAIMQAHHIPVSKGYIAKKLKELSHEVGEYQEWEQDL